MTLASVTAIITVAASWYALVTHPGKLGVALAVMTCTVGVLVICLYALFSGHLSQANFMVVFQWAGDQLKKLNPFNWGSGKT